MVILSIDDSAATRQFIKNAVDVLGFEFREAADGREAQAVLQGHEKPVDLILLDWNMPVMDGMTFLKRVRTIPDYKGVKIVMCTSESEKRKVLEAMKEGVDNYIVKPFTPEALKDKLGLH